MSYNLSKTELQSLMTKAIQAREQAYAPYSGFKVGSAVLCENSVFYSGYNIENASYGLCSCAERNTLYHAHLSGARTFLALAIVYHENELAKPCGSCRQVMHEFNPDLVLLLCNLKLEYQIVSLSSLLPQAFQGKHIQKASLKSHE
jgi:cytidine deaminase